MDSRPLVAAKYAGWSGVLRLWVFEGWPSGSGSLTGWLNRCAAGFEKRHPGVYVQPQAVDAGAVTAFRDSGILPPDMLLFPPGLLDSPEGLAALDAPEGLRAALAHCGAWGGGTYAVPVALGGYLWAWNPALTGGIPGDWAGRRDPRRAAAGRALATLGRGAAGAVRRTHEGPSPRDAPPRSPAGGGPGPGRATRAPPAPRRRRRTALPCRLPEGFDFDADAWRHFINGEAAALPVTQREVRRLEALSAQGKGPDWRLAPGRRVHRPAAVPGRRGQAGRGRRALCREFLDCLLEDESQGELCRASAFAVTDAASGYAPGDPLAALDAALRRPGAVRAQLPSTKGGRKPPEIVREFIAGTGIPGAVAAFGGRLAENPNIQTVRDRQSRLIAETGQIL